MTLSLDKESRAHAKFLVYYQLKPTKSEERTLVFTNYSIQIQNIQPTSVKFGQRGSSVRVQTEHTIYFIDIHAIESKSRDKFTLAVADDRTFNFTSKAADTVDDVVLMIKHIVSSLLTYFPAVPFDHLMKLDLTYGDRAQAVRESMEAQQGQVEMTSCGGFGMMHHYLRVYFNTAKQDEVVWDVETVYSSHNTKRMMLRDFDHLDSRDWLPIIACIAYSSYFTELDVSGVRLTNDCQQQVVNVIKKNKNLEGLYMDGCGLKSDFCMKLGSVVSLDNRLRVIDLSNNPGIEDRGLTSLCGALGKVRWTLETLKLANCGLSARSANYIGDALSSKIGGGSGQGSIAHLDLSGNTLKGEELQSFQHFLAQPNSLVTINISRCDCVVESLSNGLFRGCTQNLAVLDFSYNPFASSQNTLSSKWSALFASALSIREVRLSHCRLPVPALQDLLLGLSRNAIITAQGILLDISGNDLRSTGAQVLAQFLNSLDAVSSLDISDNDFNIDLIKIINALQSNTKLQHLAIGGNFSGLKSRQNVKVLEQLCTLLSSENSSIESLSLVDSKLKLDITVLINELANSTTNLRKLDISGNAMGDLGARILSRVLCVNERLEELIWDRNNLSLKAIEEMAGSLEHNQTLLRMTLPVVDLAPLMSRYPEKTAHLMNKIDSQLRTNHGPRKFSTEKAIKIAQGSLLTTTQQYLDKLVVSMEKYCRRLELPGGDEETIHLAMEARKLLAETATSRHLLNKLQAVATETAEGTGTGGGTMTVVNTKLTEFAKATQTAVQSELQNILEVVLQTAEEQCPIICSNESVRENTRKSSRSSALLPNDFVKKLLRRSVENEIMFKVGEVSLEMASAVSNSVLDAVITQLTACLQRLTKAWTHIVRMQRKAEMGRESQISVATTGQPASAEDEPDEGGERNEGVAMRESKIEATKERRESNLPVARGRPRSSIVMTNMDDSDNEEEGDYVLPTNSPKDTRPEPLPELNEDEEEVKDSPDGASLSVSQENLAPAKPSRSKKGGLFSKKASKDEKEKSPKKTKYKKKEKKSPEHSVDLDAVPASTPEAESPSQPLSHLGKARPRRPRAHAPTKATVRVSEEDDLFKPTETKPLTANDDEVKRTVKAELSKDWPSNSRSPLPAFRVPKSTNGNTDRTLSDPPSPPSTDPPPSDEDSKLQKPPTRLSMRPGLGMPGVAGPGMMAELKKLHAGRPVARQEKTNEPQAPPMPVLRPPPAGTKPPVSSMPTIRPASRGNSCNSTVLTEPDTPLTQTLSIKERAAKLKAASLQSTPPPVASKPQKPPKPEEEADSSCGSSCSSSDSDESVYEEIQ